MDWLVAGAVVVGAVLVLLVVRLMFTPMKLILRLLLNSATGLLLLWTVNLAGRLFAFHIGLNPVTVLLAGLLGIPGVLLLIALHFFMG